MKGDFGMIRVLDYGIDADSRQFIVGKMGKVKQKDGSWKEDIVNASYVSTLSEAYRSVYRAKVKELVHGHEMDVQQAYLAIKDVEARIQALFDQMTAGA